MVAAKNDKPVPVSEKKSPDPVFGAGLVAVGILIMGIGGAATAHYLFNLGSGVAMLGAVMFVASVALSTYRQRVGESQKT